MLCNCVIDLISLVSVIECHPKVITWDGMFEVTRFQLKSEFCRCSSIQQARKYWTFKYILCPVVTRSFLDQVFFIFIDSATFYEGEEETHLSKLVFLTYQCLFSVL